MELKAQPLSPDCLQQQLKRRLEKDLADSFLEHTSAHKEIIRDLKMLNDINNIREEIVGSKINSLDALAVAVKAQGMLEDLQCSYYDSELLLIKTLHAKILGGEFIEHIINIKGSGRILGVIMNLHTRLTPCNICAPALFRECEMSDGLAKKYQRLVASCQGIFFPFFLLMVSHSEKHKRSGSELRRASLFDGNDGAHSELINPETFAPFYPVVHLKQRRDEEILQMLSRRLKQAEESCEAAVKVAQKAQERVVTQRILLVAAAVEATDQLKKGEEGAARAAYTDAQERQKKAEKTIKKELENVNQAEKRVREFKANMKAVKAAGQLQEDKEGATEAAEVNAERMCESPEELNRRKALRFIQEHGGLGTWRNLFNDLEGHIDGKGKAPEPGQGRGDGASAEGAEPSVSFGAAAGSV